MSWRVAKSLIKLKEQVDATFPNRNRASDGTIGDTAHQAKASDHNPNAEGVVCALDLTNSPETGFDAHALADRLLANRHPDLKYIISNRRIAGDWTGWRWANYTGTSDPHINHIHVSVGVGDDGRSQRPYDDTTDWAVNSDAKPVVVAASAPLSQLQTITLPSDVDSWAVYKVGSGCRKGTSDQVGSLRPAKFGGLTYGIVQNLGNAVVIDTHDFGRVAIWVAGTSAKFGGGNAPADRKVSGGSTVTFPAHVATWAVYKVGSGYKKGSSDQVGTLLPSKFGGLTYPVVENKGNVVVIDTHDFGRVAAWVKDTDAIIR